MHQMSVDMRTGIIEVECIGFWVETEVATFARDLAFHAKMVDESGRSHRLLVDYSRATIQAQSVVAALQDLAQRIERKSERIALFTTGGLARLQAKRIAAVRDDIRLFGDRAGAMAWLLADRAAETIRPAPARRQMA